MDAAKRTTFPDPEGHYRPAVWADKRGVVHRAEGAEVLPGVLLLWTACGKHNIPANAAWIERPEDTVDCEGCLHREQTED